MVSPLLSRSLVRLLRSPGESRLREGGFAGDCGIEKDRVGKGGCKRRRRKPRPEITASIPSRLSCSTLSDSRWNQFRSLSPSYASRFGGFPLSQLCDKVISIISQLWRNLTISLRAWICANAVERKLLFFLSYMFTVYAHVRVFFLHYFARIMCIMCTLFF